jgi:hypothetical protein
LQRTIEESLVEAKGLVLVGDKFVEEANEIILVWGYEFSSSKVIVFAY